MLPHFNFGKAKKFQFPTLNLAGQRRPGTNRLDNFFRPAHSRIHVSKCRPFSPKSDEGRWRGSRRESAVIQLSARRYMKPLHSALVAIVLAVAATNFCVLCVLSGGLFISGYLAVVCAWLMPPAFYVAERTDSTLPFWLTVLSVGCLPFFIPLWIGLRLCIKNGKHAS